MLPTYSWEAIYWTIVDLSGAIPLKKTGCAFPKCSQPSVFLRQEWKLVCLLECLQAGDRQPALPWVLEWSSNCHVQMTLFCPGGPRTLSGFHNLWVTSSLKVPEPYRVQSGGSHSMSHLCWVLHWYLLFSLRLFLHFMWFYVWSDLKCFPFRWNKPVSTPRARWGVWRPKPWGHLAAIRCSSQEVSTWWGWPREDAVSLPTGTSKPFRKLLGLTTLMMLSVSFLIFKKGPQCVGQAALIIWFSCLPSAGITGVVPFRALFSDVLMLEVRMDLTLERWFTAKGTCCSVICNSSPKGSHTSFWLPWETGMYMVRISTYKANTHIHKDNEKHYWTNIQKTFKEHMGA